MEQGQQPNSASLEEELRKMILGNVTLSNDHNSPVASRGPQHQNRRHPSQNAAHYNNRGPGHQGQRWGNAGAQQPNMAPRNNNTAYRGNRSQQPSAPHPMSPKGAHFNQGGRGNYQPSPGTSGPKILQRPQNNGGSQGRPPVSPMQQSPRQPGFQQQSHLTQVPENPFTQAEYLDHVARQEVPKVEITLAELAEKESFRQHLEGILKQAVADGYSGDIETISMHGFGSLASGFATPGSDMDLAIVPIWKDRAHSLDEPIDREIPPILEKAVLEAKLGGRLLTRTRVPILKICQQPSETLYQALLEERKKWEQLSEEEKYSLRPPPEEATPAPKPLVEVDGEKSAHLMQDPDNTQSFEANSNLTIGVEASKKVDVKSEKSANSEQTNSPTPSSAPQDKSKKEKEPNRRAERPWLREKKLGPLDFPKTGVGIQCDINFGNPLGIHNTHLLRCYSLCDPRVRPMVLFVKSWAKRRKINSSYSGTLSSYGWVLMVLHYLCNIASPPVVPNLQLSWRPPKDMQGLEAMFKDTIIHGYTVRFWRNENEIVKAAQAGYLTRNTQSLGTLLRGFFQYFAGLIPGSYSYGPRPPQFYWGTEVLSLRTLGGIRSKSEKGWTGAKSTVMNGKEIRHRYLFAIEDPFELDHNVARTVTHNGIVAIRDEFRRSWRILSAVGRGQQPEGGLFDEIVEEKEEEVVKMEGTMESLVVEEKGFDDAGGEDGKAVEKMG
ncbi:hypothetical protein BDV96DRAFT_581911 [Lophiotrema nucula]|uniref:polynucleotide adenylyltransferase n=1 Tax=Lophiotrema nucula TaxID=690887 RepID=A0A6A5YXP5_9PLEO|nr:hypothetical protein BDV96DRAFT_581911 [Lophiotrema nucula]